MTTRSVERSLERALRSSQRTTDVFIHEGVAYVRAPEHDDMVEPYERTRPRRRPAQRRQPQQAPLLVWATAFLAPAALAWWRGGDLLLAGLVLAVAGLLALKFGGRYQVQTFSLLSSVLSAAMAYGIASGIIASLLGAFTPPELAPHTTAPQPTTAPVVRPLQPRVNVPAQPAAPVQVQPTAVPIAPAIVEPPPMPTAVQPTSYVVPSDSGVRVGGGWEYNPGVPTIAPAPPAQQTYYQTNPGKPEVNITVFGQEVYTLATAEPGGGTRTGGGWGDGPPPTPATYEMQQVAPPVAVEQSVATPQPPTSGGRSGGSWGAP